MKTVEYKAYKISEASLVEEKGFLYGRSRLQWDRGFADSFGIQPNGEKLESNDQFGTNKTAQLIIKC